jgi:hypothetical protein
MAELKQKIMPEWARWIAMDESGQWWCYEAEPHQYDRGWYENEVGRSEKITGLPSVESWQASLLRLKRNS